MKLKLTRRGLIRLAGVSGGLGALSGTFGIAGMLSPSRLGARLQGGIEPNIVKRRGVGLHGYDPDRAFRGFTLFAPSANTNKTVYLIDLQGNVDHSWDMPYPPGYGYLTDRGTLFYNGKIPTRASSAVPRTGVAPRWKPLGRGGSCGRCVTPTTLTTASDYRTAMSCSSARSRFLMRSSRRSAAAVPGPKSTTAR